MWSIYTTEYYSTVEMNEIMPIAASWIKLEIVILSEVSQTKANIAYRWYLKQQQQNGTNELAYKTEIESQM